MSRAVGEATLRAVEGAGVEIEYDTRSPTATARRPTG